MSNPQVDDVPAVTRRTQDITLWKEGRIAGLSAPEKKRYNKLKSAMRDYFTTSNSIDELAVKHAISVQTFKDLAQKCLMQHEDGTSWGFRALLPGITVVDHTPEPAVASVIVDEASTEIIAAQESTAEASSLKSSPAGIASAEAVSVETTLETSEEEGSEPDQITSTPGEPGATVREEVLPASEVEIAVQPAEVTQEENSGASQSAAAQEEHPPASEVETITSPNERAQEKVPDSSEPVAAIAEEDPPSSVEVEKTPDVETQLVPLSKIGVAGVNGLSTALVPIYPGTRYQTGSRKAIQQRRLVRKRWARVLRGQRQRKQFRRVFSTAFVAAILVLLVLPAGVGLAAYSAYSHIRGLATDGVNHLLDVKAVLNISKNNLTAALDVGKLQQAQSDFNRAQADFIELQQLVNRSDVQAAIVQFAPEYSGKLTMAQRLVQVGLDVSRMGSEMSGVAMLGASIIHGSPLSSGSNKPLITVTDVNAVEGAMVHALYYIDDVQLQMSQVQLKDLPISDRQKAELTSVLSLLPKARDAIIQAQGLVGIVSWLLGVGQGRRFLVQTMDRAELRPGGGFTGQYGILAIQDGRMAPFSLRDVALLDYAGNGLELGRLPPPQYRWMNFGNWGLRDANLSADFPTTAQLAMQVFQEEGGGPVDGDIALTPLVISHILQVIGPIKVPEYGEVITAKNLEDRLHYYQQDYSAIAIEEQITHNYGHQARKSFTSLVGKLLLDRVRHLPVSQLMTIAKGAIKDVQSRDLEIYFNNPAAEGWLVEHGYSGAMDTFSKQDGFMVVQANISISKASQYVHTTEQDSITLDAQGGATHNLTITLDYKPTGPIYGFDTYADYIRVYAPASAQFLGGDGFDTGRPVCHASTSAPPPSGLSSSDGHDKSCVSSSTSSSSDARYCSNGNYSLGARGYTLDTKKQGWTIDALGAPTALTSDLPGRSMWGGLTETPKNCVSTITLSWYVPHEVKLVAGQAPYSILVGKQSGYVPTVEINVDTSVIKGLKPFSYTGDLVADQVISLPLLATVPKKT